MDIFERGKNGYVDCPSHFCVHAPIFQKLLFSRAVVQRFPRACKRSANSEKFKRLNNRDPET